MKPAAREPARSLGRQADPTAAVQRYLDSVMGDPVRLRDFMLALPKGGDIHTHLSGAVPTETPFERRFAR